MLSGGATMKFFDYLQRKDKDKTDYSLAEVNQSNEIRKEYIAEIKGLKEEVQRERTFGEKWRDEYYKTDSAFKEYKYKYIVQDALIRETQKAFDNIRNRKNIMKDQNAVIKQNAAENEIINE